jgi:alkaline phosphatase
MQACNATASSNPNNRYGYRFLERSPNAAKLLLKTSNEINPNNGDRLLGLYGARDRKATFLLVVLMGITALQVLPTCPSDFSVLPHQRYLQAGRSASE